MRWKEKHNLFHVHLNRPTFLTRATRTHPTHPVSTSEHKSLHYSQDTLNPIWKCGDNIETTIHYLLHCLNYLDERRTFTDNFQSTGENILDKKDSQISELLLFGAPSNNDAIKYIYFECYHPIHIGY